MYAGIDGGASNTRIKLLDADGAMRVAAVASPSSLTLGVPEAWASIVPALEMVGVGVEQFADTHLACALAGTSRAEARAAFATMAPRFASLALCSDGHATVLGAHAGQPGAAISIGTGIVGNCIGPDGCARQVGGWGFPVRDEASGAWLGLRIMAEVLRMMDGYDVDPPGGTPLHAAVLDVVGPSVKAIAAWVHQAPSTRYATLAPLVVDAADQGDPAGMRLMRDAASEVVRLITALDPSGELALCMGGSLAAPVLPYLPSSIVARVRPGLGDACDGALRLAKGLAQSDLGTT